MRKKTAKVLIISCVMSTFFGVSAGAAPLTDGEAVESIESQRSSTAQAANNVNTQLVALLVEQEALQLDLANQDRNILKTEEDLKLANANEQKQYEEMKLRIRYMYEKGDANLWEIIAGVQSYAELINKTEYFTNIHDYDRKMLENYVLAKEEVAKAKTALLQGKAEMEHLSYVMEEQKATLNATLTQMRATLSDFDQQLALAKEAAAKEILVLQEETKNTPIFNNNQVSKEEVKE
ncbi:MAG TPA: hypothetical protein H9887_09700, partial [Candidatus Dorea intestinavium]|nr:hypothetical protein [Candidatus Dorea intestinavium]